MYLGEWSSCLDTGPERTNVLGPQHPEMTGSVKEGGRSLLAF